MNGRCIDIHSAEPCYGSQSKLKHLPEKVAALPMSDNTELKPEGMAGMGGGQGTEKDQYTKT